MLIPVGLPGSEKAAALPPHDTPPLDEVQVGAFLALVQDYLVDPLGSGD
jgi:hypothetical protein